MPIEIYKITKVLNRGVINSSKLFFSSFIDRDKVYSCRDLLKYRKNKLCTDTEYNKMAVEVALL